MKPSTRPARAMDSRLDAEDDVRLHGGT
jgi:hypothetical protein